MLILYIALGILLAGWLWRNQENLFSKFLTGFRLVLGGIYTIGLISAILAVGLNGLFWQWLAIMIGFILFVILLTQTIKFILVKGFGYKDNSNTMRLNGITRLR